MVQWRVGGSIVRIRRWSQVGQDTPVERQRGNVQDISEVPLLLIVRLHARPNVPH